MIALVDVAAGAAGRARRWVRRRGEDALTVGLVRTDRAIHTRASTRTKRTIKRTGAVVAPVLRRASGMDHLVIRPAVVESGLVAPRARAGDLGAPELRVPYGPDMDALGEGFVLAEDRPGVQGQRRSELDATFATTVDGWAHALSAAREVAVAAVSGGAGRIDAVGELIVPACSRAATRYVGVPDEHSDEVFALAQLVLHRIFLNPGSPKRKADWQLREAARRGGARLTEILDEARKHAPAGSVLHESSATALAGAVMITVSVGPHVAWAASQALDEVVRHPRRLGPTAGWGAAVPDEADAVVHDPRGRAVLEAIRLLPPTNGLVRIRPSASASPSAAPAGRIGGGVVFNLTRAADLDPTLVGRPLTFDPGRSEAPMAAFGVGAHRCPGRAMAVQLAVTILDPLLAQHGVHRTLGRDGQLRKVAPWAPLRGRGWKFPTSLVLGYEPGLPITSG